MMTLPQTFKMILGGCSVAANLTAALDIGESLETESRFPAMAAARVVSVLSLVKATRITHAGWKLKPGIELASKRWDFEQDTVTEIKIEISKFKLFCNFCHLLPPLVEDFSSFRLKISIWLSAQNTTSWSFNRLRSKTWASTLNILAKELSSFSLRG